MNTLKSILRAWARYILDHIKPSSSEIDVAILFGFTESALPLDLYSDDFDLLHSGKLHEVLVHSSNYIGNPLITVRDLKELLK